MKISQNQIARPRTLSWLVAFVSFAALLTGGTAVAGTKERTQTFPAVGHEYQVDFGDDVTAGQLESKIIVQCPHDR